MSLRPFAIRGRSASAVVCCCAGMALAAPPRIGAIALTGQPAPGTPQGVIFGGQFAWPQIDDAGSVLFFASVSGPGVTGTTDDGLWLYRAGGMSLVARSGDQVQGQPPQTTYANISNNVFVLDDSGTVFFSAAIPPVAPQGSLFRYDNGQLQLLASYGGQIIDGPPGQVWRGPTALAAAGGTVVGAYRTFGAQYPQDSCMGIGGSPLRPIIFGGTQAPGFSTGWVYAEMFSVALDGRGHTALNAYARMGSSFARAIFYLNGSTSQVLARYGGPAPTSIRDDTFENVYTPSMSRSGVVSFLGDSRAGTSLFQGTPGSLRVVLTRAPGVQGLPQGWTASGFNAASISQSGDRFAIAIGTNDENQIYRYHALAVGPANALTAVTRVGLPSPGLPNPFTFGRFNSYMVNDSGQVAFSASVTQTTPAELFTSGVWATDQQGQVHPLAIATQPFEVAPGDVRTVRTATLPFPSGEGVLNERCLNNFGQVVFSLTFTDGTAGVFVADFSPICIADFDSSGGIDGSDVQAFFDVWSAGGDRADLNDDGAVDGADVSVFFDRWEGGC